MSSFSFSSPIKTKALVEMIVNWLERGVASTYAFIPGGTKKKTGAFIKDGSVL